MTQEKGFKVARYGQVMVAVGLQVLSTGVSRADEAALLAQLRASIADSPTAVAKALIPSLYGVYFNSEAPRAFVDANLRFIGNSSTGYTYLSGPRRGHDLSVSDAQALFREYLAAIPREKLMTYRFGAGQREVFLITAYDCPNCRTLEREFVKQAKTLNATVYLVPTALQYGVDPQAKPLLRDVLCAERPEVAWNELVLQKKSPATAHCAANPDDFAFLSRSFPVKFPITVPTAVTSDGRIHTLVLAKFDEVFRGR